MSYAALEVLRTPRLELRPLVMTDADAMAEGVGNYDVSRWLAVVPYPYGRDHAFEFIQKVHDQDKPFWAIENARGLIGVISVADELGYWLARTAWGKGYGFEAAQAVVAWWFAQGGGDLASGYFEGNERSGRVLRALGFRLAGHETRFARAFRQDVQSNRMVLTRADWEARAAFTLYTPRLTLRPMTADDAPALAALAVPEISRMLASLAPQMSRDEARRYIEALRWRGLPGFILALEHEGRVIGAVGIGGAPVSVMYFLAPEAWGRGFATEALSAVLPEIFERFPLSRLIADCFEDNGASRRVLEKLGFAETGREMGASKGRLEPAPVITYAVTRETLRVAA